MLEDSSSKKGNSCPPDDSPMQQNNPQPIGASEHEDDSSKILESSALRRGNLGPVEEIQIQHNNHQTVIAFEMPPETQPQLSEVPLSSSPTLNNSVCNIGPSPQSSMSTSPPVEVPKLPNLPGLFYFGLGSLFRVDHIGICKAEDNSLWELNVDPDLVRSTSGSSDFPSNFDKEMLDSVGNRDMLNYLFAMLGRAMAMLARLVDSTVDINEIRSLDNEVEGLRREKQDLLDTLDMKLLEIRNLESDVGWEKKMLEQT